MKYNTVIEGLTELHVRLSADDTWQAWPKEFSTAYRFQAEATVLLSNKARADATKHALWHKAQVETYMDSTFSALFWIMSFEHLARLHNVPMSWIAALRFTVQPSYATGEKWGLKPLPTFINKDGHCFDSLWASHLDGVEQGLIINKEFPYMRDPEEVAISDAALAKETLESSTKSTW